MGNISHSATLDVSNYVAGINKMKQETSNLSNTVVQESDKMDASLRKIGAGLAAYFTFDAASAFIKKLTQVRGEFQQLEIGFETMLGSKAKAEALMAETTEFATKTPFELGGIAAAAKQLIAYGVASEEVVDTLRRLGDISSGLNIPLQDLSYLYGTTLVQGRMYAQDLMQFSNRGIPLIQELAKQFNVSTAEVKNLVSEGKVGFPEVEKAIKAMTDEGGRFAGLTEKNSTALTGLVSNLEDAIQNALNELGQEQEGVLAAGIKGAILVVEHYKEIAKVLAVLVAAVGSYKAATIAAALAQKAIVAAGHIKAWLSLAKGVRSAKDAMLLFNLACKANPFVLAASILTTAAAAISLFGDSTEDTVKELSTLEKIEQEVTKEVSTQKAKIDSLTSSIHNETLSLEAKKKALSDLKELIPDYTAELDKEGRVIAENTTALDDYIKSIEKSIRLKSAQEELAALFAKQRELEQNKEAGQGRVEELRVNVNRAKEAYSNFNYSLYASKFGEEAADYAEAGHRGAIANMERALNNYVESLEAPLREVNAQIALLRGEIEKTEQEIDAATQAALNNAKTYPQAVEEAKATVSKLREELAKLRSGETKSIDYVKDIENKEKELRAAEKRLETLTGKKDDTEAERRKYIQNTKRRLSLEQEAAEKLIDQKRESEKAIAQASIDALQEGFDKQFAQQQLDHEQNLQSIRVRAEEMRKATYAYNKRVWESKHEGIYENTEAGKKGWQAINLTPEERAQIDALLSSETARWSKAQEELLDSEISAMYDYLKQYGSIQEQKFAIAQEYERRIAKEQDFWRRQTLQAEKKKALDSINSAELVKQLNLELLFSDYGALLAAPLEQTLSTLEEYIKTDAFQMKSFEEQKAVIQSMDEARKQLGIIENASISSIGESLYAYNTALLEYNRAVQDMTELARLAAVAEEEELRATQALADAKDDAAKAEAERNLRAAKEKNQSAQENFIQGQQRQQQAQTTLIQTQAQATNALNDFQSSIAKVGEIAQAVASGSLSQLWKALGKKLQNRIGNFVSGTRDYSDAVVYMTDILSKSNETFDSFIGKISDLTKQLYESGLEIDAMDIPGKVKKLFEDAFGSDNKDLAKLGEEVAGIIENAISSSKGDKVGEVVDAAADAASKVGEEVVKAVTKASGSLWGLIIGLVLDLLEVLKEGLGTLLKTILDSVGEAIEGILTEIGSGQFFVRLAEGIGNVVAGVVKGVANLFSGGLAFSTGNEEEQEALIEKLILSNEALDESIKSLTETISEADSTNKESIDAYNKALAAEKEWQQNQRDAINARASEWTNTGYGFLGLGGKSSFNAHMPGSDWSGWKAFSDALKAQGINKSVTSQNIWSLSPEEMRILRDYSPKAWGELFAGDGHRNPKELVEEYIDRAGAIDALTSALNEKLTGYSWDSFKDSYVSMLKDLTSTTEDFADNIEELITNALITTFVNSEAIQGRIRGLYQKIAAYSSEESEGGTELTQKELEDIRNTNQGLAEDLINYRDALIEAGMIKQDGLDKYQQTASSRGFAAMSQETGEALEGRFTAIQINTANILSAVIEIQSLIILQVNHLESISSSTKLLSTINSNLASIKEKLKNI